MMKIKTLCLLFVCMYQPLSGHAEGYLFPTDVLDVGKVDAQIGIGKSDYEADFSDGIVQGVMRSSIVRETVQARYGIAPNWHVGLILPYDSTANEKFEDLRLFGTPIPSQTNQLNKSKNLELFAKYQWIADKNSPYSLSTGLLVAPSTAGFGMTFATVNVIGGWRVNSSVRAYAGYEGRFTDREEAANSHSALLGLHYQLNDMLTFVPGVAYRNYESTTHNGTRLIGRHSELDAGLSLHWQVLPNTYVIPSVTLAHIGSYQRGILQVNDTSDATTYAVNLYHLF